MIIHTEDTTTATTTETFSYYFSHATGNMLHIGSRENAKASPSKLIEIIVDASLYAQQIDGIIDSALIKAQEAVAHIPRRDVTGAFDIPAKDDHLEALFAHLGLDSNDESLRRRVHLSPEAITLGVYPVKTFTYDNISYRVVAANAALTRRGQNVVLDNGCIYDVCPLRPADTPAQLQAS